MLLIKSIIVRLILIIKEIKNFSYSPSLNKLNIKTPYFSQFASKELVEDFILGRKKVENDPNWEKLGANNKKEYAIWVWNGCGMACLQMILKKDIPLVNLGKKCFEYGGYTVNKKAKKVNDYRSYYDGLFYEPFVKFIKNEYGLKGKVVSPMVIKEIIKALEEKKYVIASVNPQIRNPKEKPKYKRGHLVLVVGYNWDKQVLYFHNPSGFYKKSQEFVQISFSDFSNFFADRGMVIGS